MRFTPAILAPLLALLAASASASAAPPSTTLGQVATSSHSCEVQHVYLQISSATGLPSYTVPAPGGIITSWSEAPLSGSGTERLVVAQPTATSGQYTALAISPEEAVSGTSTQTFPIHVPVEAGDILGLEPVSGSIDCDFPDGLPTATTSGDLIEVIPGEYSQGELLAPKSGADSTEPEGDRLNLEAVLQPDADHDGYGDSTEDACPTDPSTHEACPVPTITGVAAAGQTLSANPEGSPENPAYAWLRCNASGASCRAISGATSLTYTVTTVDAGHTLRFRKTASNYEESQITESAPTAVVPAVTSAAVTPSLSSVSQSAARWREGNALARFSRRSSVSVGTTFGFTVNLPVPITLSFTQKASGRSVSGKCVAPAKHNEHRPGCTRTVTLGALYSTAHVGRNTVSFQGRLSPSLLLKPGLYTVKITAGSPKQHSVSKSLSFTILAP